MPALNFKKEFSRAVELGIKKQTIRQVRKHPIKIGDVLYLKTGMRTKQCKSLGIGICSIVLDIYITEKSVFLNQKRLTFYEIRKLYLDDGFETTTDFIDFFKKQYKLPFKGVLIRWTIPESCFLKRVKRNAP